ncbi:MAG TPA: hypothetical protein VK658_23255 [Chryseolinea sp.]|nr:hypothetical protein [Chryseolinea sp.]
MIRVVLILFMVCVCFPLLAQFSRLHIKSPSASVLAISAGGTSNKVIGIHHDGTAGIISATTLDGGSQYTPLKFSTAGVTRLTIFENGFIGIGGVGTPTAELTVAGKVHAREVKVNVSAGTGPDYVFLDTYRLRTLSEVSGFINRHRHLPDVPPAIVMEKDGVSLGEMNMVLLKKIEELTLYLIDQNGKMEALNFRVSELEDKLKELKSSN